MLQKSSELVAELIDTTPLEELISLKEYGEIIGLSVEWMGHLTIFEVVHILAKETLEVPTPKSKHTTAPLTTKPTTGMSLEKEKEKERGTLVSWNNVLGPC